MENTKDVTLIEVKEKLLKEFERLEKKETTERAFKVNVGRFKGGQDYGRKRNGTRRNSSGFKGNNVGFKGKCFKCGQVGHFKRDRRKRSKVEENDAVFAVGQEPCAGWLIDSGATSHMTPHQSDLFDYEALSAGPEVTIADGKKLRVTGRGTVKLTGLDGLRIKMVEVLHIPGIDRRLLSVGKLAERGLKVKFQRSSCLI